MAGGVDCCDVTKELTGLWIPGCDRELPSCPGEPLTALNEREGLGPVEVAGDTCCNKHTCAQNVDFRCKPAQAKLYFRMQYRELKIFKQ